MTQELSSKIGEIAHARRRFGYREPVLIFVFEA